MRGSDQRENGGDGADGSSGGSGVVAGAVVVVVAGDDGKNSIFDFMSEWFT